MADRPAPIPQAVAELWELVVAYFRQETTEPLKALGRVVGFGVAGSLLIGTGVVLAAVGALRVLQYETDAFHGNWSFVPYAIVIVALIAIAAAVFLIGTRAKTGPPTKDSP
ncbi:MAG: phage holin family protein [Acidimicrobiia bacterium]